MENVIVVFDIGKTNKKMLLFNKKMELVYQFEEKFPTVLDDDHFECDDVNLIVKWIKSVLENLIIADKYRIEGVNFSTYGATLAYVAEDGSLVTPLYNYLKAMPSGLVEVIYEKFGGVREFCRMTASPALGMLNSGFQVLWLKKAKPEIFHKVKYIMHFPQYLSYCLTGKVTSEYTSIGCHTALWDFDSNAYHPWLLNEGIRLPLPLSNDTLYPVEIAGKTVEIGIGIHDSSASLVPYLQFSEEPFILISTGTWCIFMNPFNEEPLTDEQLQKDSLCYMSTLQRQVKSSRLFMGHIHDVNVQRLADFYHVQTSFFKCLAANEIIVNEIITKHKGNSVFFSDGIPADFVDNRVDLSVFSGIEEAYHQLIVDLTYKAVESLQLIIAEDDPTQTIYISGGFARNEIFVRFLAALLPNKKVYTSEIDNASALGAALTVSNKTMNGTTSKMDLGLKLFNPFIIGELNKNNYE